MGIEIKRDCQHVQGLPAWAWYSSTGARGSPACFPNPKNVHPDKASGIIAHPALTRALLYPLFVADQVDVNPANIALHGLQHKGCQLWRLACVRFSERVPVRASTNGISELLEGASVEQDAVEAFLQFTK